MTAQEIAAFLLGALALGYLGSRLIRKRATGNCCGETECPATKRITDRFKSSA